MQSGLTLFAFDCSYSVNNISLYFTTLQSIVDKYYVKDRGDIFVKWDDIFRYETYEELQTWIKSQKGYGLTSAEQIAQVLKEQGPKIKHLIITTDGYIDSSNVTKSDNLLNELGWKPEYVTVYIIGTSAKDVSVVTPYVRESPHIIYDVNINETKIIEEVLPNYIKSFTEMHNIKSKTIFMERRTFQEKSFFQPRDLGNGRPTLLQLNYNRKKTQSYPQLIFKLTSFSILSSPKSK